ncbi:shikimate dehydrogenase family protein [Ochrobactrum sp. S1502_03]|uniref:shikimate dehydrogenase family protein n=1 Tax=Ochrobactrum sp. S1502_03 TaxID=3108451 RepID=UPI0037CC5331
MNGTAQTPELGLPLPLTGASRVYAILGDPIVQAGSPGLFNQAFRAKGVQAALVPFHVGIEKLDIMVEAFRSIGNFDGLVITVPHKIAIAGMLDDLGPMARRIGAVNAIKKLPDGRLIGDNFDGLGFIHGLAKKGHSVTGRHVLLIGAGGAGSAIAHAVIDEAPASIGVVDIDRKRADTLLDDLGSVGSPVSVSNAESNSQGYDVIINCTSLGMRETDPLPVSPDILKPGALVVDIILKPPISRLLQEAETRGCAVHAGIHMLSGQVEAICRFFELPEEDNDTRA